MIACDFPLFVPGNKPDRFAKAIAAAHDAVVIDLEDAVTAEEKATSRDALVDQKDLLDRAAVSVFIRVNGRNTKWYADDVACCADLPIAGVILPKSQSGEDLRALASALPGEMLRLALIETAAGLVEVASIARQASRLVFGSIDFCADLGCEHDRLALLRPRQDLVLWSRLAGLPAPIDGVTTALRDEDLIREDAAHAAMLGFGGKLLIHPAQIPAALAGFAPSDADTAWAQRVLDGSSGEAVAVDGAMVDAPVLVRAQAILDRNR